jgi:rubredoxin
MKVSCAVCGTTFRQAGEALAALKANAWERVTLARTDIESRGAIDELWLCPACAEIKRTRRPV